MTNIEKTQKNRLLDAGYHPPSQCPTEGLDAKDDTRPCEQCLDVLEETDTYISCNDVSTRIEEDIAILDPETRYPSFFIFNDTENEGHIIAGHGKLSMKDVLKSIFENDPIMLSDMLTDIQTGELGKTCTEVYYGSQVSFHPKNPNDKAKLKKVRKNFEEFALETMFDSLTAIHQLVDFEVTNDMAKLKKLEEKAKRVREQKETDTDVAYQ